MYLCSFVCNSLNVYEESRDMFEDAFDAIYMHAYQSSPMLNLGEIILAALIPTK